MARLTLSAVGTAISRKSDPKKAMKTARLTLLRRSVEPAGCAAALRVQRHPSPPKRPTHIRDRDEERRRQAIELANLAGEQGGLAAESHGADAGLIGLLDHAL